MKYWCDNCEGGYTKILPWNAPAYVPGDIDENGTVDISDVIALLQHSLFPDLYPVDYPGDPDFNHDGSLDIQDVIVLLQYSIFPDLYPLG